MVLYSISSECIDERVDYIVNGFAVGYLLLKLGRYALVKNPAPL